MATSPGMSSGDLAGGPAVPVLGADAASEASVRRWLALLVAAYVLTALAAIGTAPLANRAEHRCLEVVRNMVASGDWLVPRYEGAVRLNKPPLAYWAGAVVSSALGEASLLAVRLPSLVAGIGLLLVTFAWGRRVGGARLGLAATACLVAMELVIAYGRRGVAEMELAFAANLALYLFDRLLDEPRTALRAAFGLALGLALLAKATAGLMLVAVPVVVTLTLRRRWRSALALRNLVWVAAAFALGAAWYAAILAFVPDGWRLLEADLLLPFGVEDAAPQVGAAHFNPPWFHLHSLLTGATPALLLLPWAIARAARTRLWQRLPRQRFAFVVFASLFVAFSLLPQKQKHYMLPLLPALAILLADGVLASARLDAASFARTVRRLGFAAAAVVLLAFGLAVARESGREADAAPALLLVPIGLLLAVTLAAAARSGRPANVGGAGVAAWLVAMVLYGVVFEPRLPPPDVGAPATSTAPATDPGR